MPNTMTLISAVTVGAGGASSIDFTSIPQTYTDLCLKFSTRANATDSADAWDTILKFNTVATNLTFASVRGDGAGVNFNSLTDRALRTTVPSNWTTSTFSSAEMYVYNYTSATTKSFSIDSVIENNAATSPAQIIFAGAWANNSAINQITLVPNSGSFVQYSTAYLYGIKNS